MSEINCQTSCLQTELNHPGELVSEAIRLYMTPYYYVMARTYDPKTTAVLLVVSYNDFLSEGGKLWPLATGAGSWSIGDNLAHA